MTGDSLRDRRILVVEDEYLLAEELREGLTAAGACVIGPASSIARARALLELQSPLDGAVLDVNLGGESVYPLADMLVAQRVPLIFTTGYDPNTLPERYDRVVKCGKPLDIDRVTKAIDKAIKA